MPIYVNVDGVWREVTTPSFNLNGTFINFAEVMVNVNGTWVNAWTAVSEPIPNYQSIYYVLPNNTASDINNAISLMDKGGLILFGAGEWIFTERIHINKSNITIRGNKGLTKIVCDTVFTEQPFGLIVIFGTDSNPLENVIVEGLEITNSAMGESDGFSIGYIGYDWSQTEREPGLIIRDCYIHNIVWDAINVGEIGSLVRIENNIIEDCDRGSVITNWGFNNTINNNIYKNCSTAILLTDDAESNNIIGNMFENNNIAIYTRYSNTNSIISNSIYNCIDRGILIENSFSSTISNNIVKGSTNTGIYSTSSVGNKIINNFVSDNKGDGIGMASTDNTIVSGNVVRNNTASGIWLGNGNNNIITSNSSLNSGSSININIEGGTNIINNHNIIA